MSENSSQPNLATILDCDVIVIGADPAGAAAAAYLAKAGAKVIVLEKQQLPGNGLFGCCVSPASLRELQNLGISQQPEFQGNVIDCATIYINGKKAITDVFPDIDKLPRFALMISEPVLQNAVVAAPRTSGAMVLEGMCVLNFAVEKDWVTVIAQNKEGIKTFRARLLIGADGPDSMVARKLKGVPLAERAVAARGYFTGVSGIPNEANLYYNNESFPGYSWLFPTTKGEANVGVGLILGATPPAGNPADVLKKLLETDEGLKLRLKDAQLKGELEIAEVNMYDPTAPLVGDRVMVIGLAAGLVNPYNGEGLQMGLLSARWAAETAQTCLASNIFSKEALSPYTWRIEGKFGYGFKLSKLILGIAGNRNLNTAWIQWLELMAQKSKTDAEFKRTIGGILSAMIFPNEDTSIEAFIGTLQEAAMQAGLEAAADMKDEAKRVQAQENLRQTAATVAQYVSSDPQMALRWAFDAVSRMAGVAAVASKQVLKNSEKTQQSSSEQ